MRIAIEVTRRCPSCFSGTFAHLRWEYTPKESLPSHTAKLQWGHRLSAMETPHRGNGGGDFSLGFNGTTAFRRWKQAAGCGPTAGRAGFNGATAFRRWKLQGLLFTFFAPIYGFNGATAFRRWKLARRRVGRELADGFNGATAFRRWKRRPATFAERVASDASMGPPPFGDGNHPAYRGQAQGAHASMGPPPFGDGNEPVCSRRVSGA